MSQNSNPAEHPVPMGDYLLQTADGYDYVRPAFGSGMSEPDPVMLELTAMLNAARHGYAVGPMAEKFQKTMGQADKLYTAAAMTAGALLARRSQSWP